MLPLSLTCLIRQQDVQHGPFRSRAVTADGYYSMQLHGQLGQNKCGSGEFGYLSDYPIANEYLLQSVIARKMVILALKSRDVADIADSVLPSHVEAAFKNSTFCNATTSVRGYGVLHATYAYKRRVLMIGSHISTDLSFHSRSSVGRQCRRHQHAICWNRSTEDRLYKNWTPQCKRTTL